jgi:hypothetical protein
MARGVKFSRASAAFAALLAISLASKAAVNVVPREPSPVTFARAASAMLRDGGYRVSLEPRNFAIIVHGARAACRLSLTDYTPYGTFADPIAAFARPIGRLSFAYRGRFYDHPPKVMPLTDYYLVRELRRIGIDAPRRPIVAVAAAPGCALGLLDWRRLTELRS